jgi:hypothetical protein
MAVSQLNSTTLTSAIARDAFENVVVGSTANISAGSLLVFAGKGGLEVARVQSVPVSGQVNLMRGVGGTRARAHAAGTNIYIGSPTPSRTPATTRRLSSATPRPCPTTASPAPVPVTDRGTSTSWWISPSPATPGRAC